MPQNPITPLILLNGVTTVSTGSVNDLSHLMDVEDRYYTAHLEGSGSVSASVVVEVSNNNSHWITLMSFSLAGTDSDTDGELADESWRWVRGRVTAISGTDAEVTLTLGF